MNMLTEVDIERIMAAQRQLTESVTESFSDKEAQALVDDECFEILDYDASVSEINGLM